VAKASDENTPTAESEKPAAGPTTHYLDVRLVGESKLTARSLQAEGPLDKASLRAKIEQHADKIKDANEVLAYLDEVQAPQSCEPAPAATQPKPTEPIRSVATPAWIRAELIELLKTKAIPEDIRIGDLSELLSKRMHAAAETNKWLHPVGWEHIKNNLSDWELWPLKTIKIP
jgi:hypothetical protein